jgi:Ca-activated chloride channel homolog
MLPVKTCILFLTCYLLATTSAAQYFVTGEVKDEKQIPITNARIFVHSAKRIFYSGSYGDFGFNSTQAVDSITVSKEGYETKVMRISTTQPYEIVLKIPALTASKNRPKLISVTKDMLATSGARMLFSDESYFQIVENTPILASKYPKTGFSLNVNKASYANVRRFINEKSVVPPDAVRTEELVNYFNLRYKPPTSKNTFEVESQLTGCPYDATKNLLFVNINAKKLDLEKAPPSNFVFLIDCSGSMDMPNKLPLLKAAFQMFVKNLRVKDTVSIVTYGGTVAVWLQPTGGAAKDSIIKRIEELEAVGDTPGESAILMAYKLAQRTFIKGGNNRVILATDGDFNVGITKEEDLEELITREKQKNVFLTCLGVGMGNLKDSKLETLAKRGNGNYAYLDNVLEAEKVLVKEITQTMFAVAHNVFMDVTFNDKYVKEYRLIGFDNKKEAILDSTINLEGGEVGSGNNTIAIFEVIPTTEKSFTNDAAQNSIIATIDLKYTNTNETEVKYLQQNLFNNYTDITQIDSSYKFAAAVTMFALKIRGSAAVKDYGWDALLAYATKAYNANNYLQKDFMVLLQKAYTVYDNKKRRNK